MAGFCAMVKKGMKRELMMKLRLMLYGIGLSLAMSAFADCDLKRFRWECALPMQMKPSAYSRAPVWCGHVLGYLTRERYDRLLHYRRVNVNMVLDVNGEYIDSPCVPH